MGDHRNVSAYYAVGMGEREAEYVKIWSTCPDALDLRGPLEGRRSGGIPVRLMYELWYRWGTPPWSGAPREELIQLVESGRLQPGRAIDLGCGIGDNWIFLAKHGFNAVGVDFAASAIRKAQDRALAAGVDVEFHVDNLTGLQHVDGTFDLLVDYGTFDDLKKKDRAPYVETVRKLIQPGTKFLFWCFEWELRRWERCMTVVLRPFGPPALEPGEVEKYFGGLF